MNLRAGVFFAAMLMVSDAPLLTAAHDELSLGLGVVILGKVDIAACAGVGDGFIETPLVANELLRLDKAELGWTPTLPCTAEGTKAGKIGLSGKGSDLKTVGNCTILKPSCVKPD